MSLWPVLCRMEATSTSKERYRFRFCSTICCIATRRFDHGHDALAQGFRQLRPGGHDGCQTGVGWAVRSGVCTGFCTAPLRIVGIPRGFRGLFESCIAQSYGAPETPTFTTNTYTVLSPAADHPPDVQDAVNDQDSAHQCVERVDPGGLDLD